MWTSKQCHVSPCDKIYLSGPPHKNYNFNYTSDAGDQCASSRQISSKWVKRFQIQSDLTFFQNGGRPPSWICRGAWWSLLLFKNGWNPCSSFAILKPSTFCPFGLKAPVHAPEIGVLGDFTPRNGEQCKRNPKRHILARVRVVWASSVRICRRVWPVGEFP